MVWLPSAFVTTVMREGSNTPSGAGPERSAGSACAWGLSWLPVNASVPPTMRLASLTRPPLLAPKPMRTVFAMASGVTNSRPLASSTRMR